MLLPMKSFAYKWIWLFIVLAVGACSNAGEEFSSPVVENIRFDIEVVPMTRVGTDLLFSCNWEEGDEIGIFAVKAGEALNASANLIHNVKLVYSEGEWRCDSALIWYENMPSLNFYAYYPYNDNNGFPEKLNPLQLQQCVALDQNAELEGRAAYNTSDLLLAQTYVEKGEVVTLSFSHALSLVQLELQPGNNTEDFIEQLTVKLCGVYPTYLLNLEKEVLSLSNEKEEKMDISMLYCGTNREGNRIYRALLPPQILTIAAPLFRFERNGETLFETAGAMEYVRLFAGSADCFCFELPELE